MNREQIIDFVSEFGFSLWSTKRGHGETELHFMESKYGINLWVNMADLGFRFEWAIPNTYFSIRSPKCSPVTNIKHFQNVLRQFKKPVAIYLANFR